MAQDYKIIHYEAKPDAYVDSNGNTWVNVLFEGAANEPIRWAVKDVNAYSVGQSVYGHIEEKTSQANKPYLRFYRDQRDNRQTAMTGNMQSTAQSAGQAPDDRQDIIRAEFAIKTAIALGAYKEFHNFDDEIMPYIENRAKVLYAMVDRVKGSNLRPGTIAAPHAQHPTTAPTTDYEAQSLYNSVAQAETVSLAYVPEEYR